jgi:hypothetical protein
MYAFCVHYVFNASTNFLRDIIREGEEIPDEVMGGWSKFFYRVIRAFEIPSFGVITPMGWVGNLAAYVTAASLGGSGAKTKDAFLTYLKGSDESLNWWKGYPIGKDIAQKLFLNSKNLVENAEGEIVKTKAGDDSQSSIEKEAGVDLSDEKSNDEKSNDKKSNDEEVKEIFYKHLQSDGLQQIRKDFLKKDGDYWTFEYCTDADCNGKEMAKAKYDPTTKTFGAVEYVKTK